MVIMTVSKYNFVAEKQHGNEENFTFHNAFHNAKLLIIRHTIV